MPQPRYAESRWTKGPIYIGNLPGYLDPGEGMSGTREMFPEAVQQLKWQFPYMSRERDFLEKELPQDRGSMYVWPEPDDAEGAGARNSRLFRHEGIHNLLDQGLAKTDENEDLVKLRQMHRSPRMKPFASKAKIEFKKAGWMGEPDLEVPAYLGTNDLTKFGAQKVGVTPEVREGYMRELLRQLQRSDPRTASILKRMSDTLVGGK